MNRRRFLRNTGSLAAIAWGGQVAQAGLPRLPVIDSHIHLFDPTRPGGVPWPEKTDPILYRSALPARFAQVSAPLGIVGGIAIEASPLLADNDWLLQTAAQSPLIVAVIGNLDPAAPNFTSELERLRKNPLFRGIRFGNLWGRDLVRDLDRPGFMEGLRRLAEAGLVFESANPNPALIHALAEISNQLPHLTLVVDHLANATQPVGSEEATYLHDLQTLAASAHVFVKLSEIAVHTADPAACRARIEPLWQLFGEDKLMYGSDWPNSDTSFPYAVIFRVLREYLQSKSITAREKVYWRNSRRAYTWQSRSPTQLHLA